ncbi:MoaD family protein [Alkalibaculum sp. M08DMB]|uniref:MoaD family protein n=1 Tax=Alkalibaculum sporogenes TaxID=2655001 RepID=A0A6A7KAN6_9FIRM|nr:MoaD family protein [Alkalibaculum sporogenes]MPW26456.1 MoaD family protein [Alkalibaculum sporogenes]
MIEIRLKTILGIVNLVGGLKEQKVYIEQDARVFDLLEILVLKYGHEFKQKIFDDSMEINRGIAMFINGRNIYALDGLKTKLCLGDEFLIFPPVGGG